MAKNYFLQMWIMNLKNSLQMGMCCVLMLCAMGLQGSVRSVFAGEPQRPSVEGRTSIAIAENSHRSLASKSKGCVIAWGYRGSFCVDNAPEGNDFVDIAATEDYCLALKSDGAIVGWGFDFSGHLVPNDGNDFVAIAGGSGHSLALRKDGSIVTWGRNNSGQANPPSGNDFVAIAAGSTHSLALKADGSIVGWGSKSFGEGMAPGGNHFVAIAAGAHFSLALKSNGSVAGWGKDDCGQASPPYGTDFVAIAAGYRHGVGLKSDGTISCWGENNFDQCKPPPGDGFVAVAADLDYSLALRSDGSIVSWGNTKSRAAARPPSGTGFAAIAAGRDHALGILRADLTKGTSEAQKKETTQHQRKEESPEVIEVENVSVLKSVESPHKMIRLTTEDQMSVDLVYIKPGSFVMGRDVGLAEKVVSRINKVGMVGKYPNDWPARKVTITKGFYIGKYKVTTAQFCEFLNSIPNAEDYIALNKEARIGIKDGAYVPKPYCEDCEVNVVHWRGAVAFCEWLSTKTGLTVRLPTEAEWEFVTRGPGAQSYSLKGGGRIGWTESTRGETDEEKRSYARNCPPIDPSQPSVTPDGVVGMGGLVGEWCSDFYGGHYLKDDLIDPKGPRGERLTDKSIAPFGEKYHVRRWGPKGAKRHFAHGVIGDSGTYGFRIVVELPVDRERNPK